METYQGYFVEQDKFIPTGAARIPLRRRAIVTILDEPMQDELLSDDVGQRLRMLDKLNAMVDASAHEEVPLFERADLHREVEL